MSSFSSGGRCPVLRSVAILHLAAAVMVVVGGIVGAVWTIFSRAAIFGPLNWENRIMYGVGVLVAAFFASIFLVAVSEVLKLLIDIERNTRLSAGEKAGPLEGEETAEGALLRGR